MPHLSNVSHHCLDTGCAVCSSGNVCLIAEMFVDVCDCWLHDFIPKFSQSPPCSWHWQILTQSNIRHIRVPSSVFRILQPLRPVSFMRWPCLLPGHQGHPGSHPGCLLHCLTPEVTLATRQICPENSTSRLTVQMLLRAPHTRGECKWLH